MSGEMRQAAQSGPGERGFALLSQLAATLTMAPSFDGEDPELGALRKIAGGSLNDESLKGMLASPSFSPHFKAIARAHLPKPECSAELISRLSTEEGSQICVMLVTCPMQEFDQAAELVAAAVMQRRFLTAITKQQRDALKTAFSETAQKLGASEAVLLYQSLGELDKSATDHSNLPVREIGLATLDAFVRHLDGELLAAFSRRSGKIDDSLIEARKFSVGHGRLIRKLLNRKCPKWKTQLS